MFIHFYLTYVGHFLNTSVFLVVFGAPFGSAPYAAVVVLRGGWVGYGPPDFWLDPCFHSSFVLNFTFKFV